MRYIFEIPGRFPGLNEIIEEARTHPMASAKQKKTYTNAAALAVRDARNNCKLPREPMDSPISVNIDWFEPNAKRDPDNIMAGQKFILDALVKERILRGDGQADVAAINHRFHVDAANPRVLVDLFELILEQRPKRQSGGKPA